MESPFRSEEAAFRFLLLSIGAFALIVLASWLNPWLGLLVFLALSGAAVWAYTRQRAPSPPREQIEQLGSTDEKRVLVVANETVGGDELMQVIGELALTGRSLFYVVCPALNSRLRTWTSDEDPARAAAQKRVCTRRSSASPRSASRRAATWVTSILSSRSRMPCGSSDRTSWSSRRIPRGGRTGSSEVWSARYASATTCR